MQLLLVLKSLVLLWSCSSQFHGQAFQIPVFSSSPTTSITSGTRLQLAVGSRRYGPPCEDQKPQNQTLEKNDVSDDYFEWNRQQEELQRRQESDFRDLLEKVLSTTKPEHIPSLMTQNMGLLLNIPQNPKFISQLLEEAEQAGGAELEQNVMMTIEFMLSFAEEFVNQTKTMDDMNKQLLGKIIKNMANKETGEDQLDELLEQEKENFTPGFLRHIEGECERITGAPKITPESTRLMETLRVIQARVLEELGQDLGEGALILGQLLGYDDEKERIAVLEAGLTVRGVGFAQEMADLTKEALEGFQRVGADPELVKRVEQLDARIRDFIDKNNVLQ